MINVSNLVGGVVSISRATSHPVEALAWDITLGTAGTGLGQLILGRTSSSSEMVPEAIDHVGIVLFGYLYEFGDLGILKTPVPLQSTPESKYPVFHLRSREKIGETEKSQEEFEAWVELMKSWDFRGSDYNVVTRSCVVWAIKACEFLGVEYPKNWDKLCDWARENSTVAGLIGGSGVQARKVQIKAQTSEAPKKLFVLMKKKFKKKKKGDSSKSPDTGNKGSTENPEDLENADNESSTSNDSSSTNGESGDDAEKADVLGLSEALENSVTITRL